MVNAQEWLNENYPLEKRTKVKEIYLTEPSLEGKLDLEDFTYEDSWGDGVKVLISFSVDETKLEMKNKREKAKVIKLVKAQNYINQQYPTKQKREEVNKLYIGHKNLEGDLTISDFINLKELYCHSNKLTFLSVSNCLKLSVIACNSNKLTNLIFNNCPYLVRIDCRDNLLTSLTLPTNPTNLKNIDLSDNDFSVRQDLSFLVSATNLEELNLGNNKREKINRGIYNKFTGSLDYLSEIKNLQEFDISNTDIDKIDVSKLPSNLKRIEYSTWLRQDSKLTQIVPHLKKYEWKDLHSDFSLLLRKGWEKAGLNKEQTREWIELGIRPNDYKFVGQLNVESKNAKILNYRDEQELREEIINSRLQLSNKKIFLNSKQVYNTLNKFIPNEELRERYKEWGLCKECDQFNTPQHWCKLLSAKHFQKNFDKWTSGNFEIDEFIQSVQLKAKKPKEVLEWIPYDRFTDVQHLADGGFGKVYKAKWIDGYIKNWNNQKKKWGRIRTNHNTNYDGMIVLKVLNNSQNMTTKFLQEITYHKLFNISENIVNCYGISQDPETKNYVMIMDYMKDGNLRQYLKDNYSKLSFSDKFNRLYDIIGGLNSIHKQGLIHHDFHSGNMLLSMYNDCFISDLGLSRPADEENKDGGGGEYMEFCLMLLLKSYKTNLILKPVIFILLVSLLVND